MALQEGDKISSSLSDFVYFFTETDDLRDSAEKHGLSLQLLYKVLARERPLTKKSIPLVYTVLKKAVANRMVLIPKLNSANIKANKLIKEQEIPTT